MNERRLLAETLPQFVTGAAKPMEVFVMSWQSIDEVPERLRKIGGAPLTLDQAKMIAQWAESFAHDDTVRNPWGVAVARFRRTHELADGLWSESGEDVKNDSGPGYSRVAIKFAKKHFRNAGEAEEWIETETDLPLDEDHTVEEHADGFYYVLTEYDDKAATREEPGEGLGVSYIFAEKDRIDTAESSHSVADAAAHEAARETIPDATTSTTPAAAHETFDIENVEIFRTGEWTDSTGRTINYTENDLREMADAYNNLKGRFEAPVKLGHEKEQPLLKSDGLPAAGWLANLRVRGGSLLADLKDVPKKIFELIKSNAYKKRSLEVLHDFRDAADGRVYKHVAAGLALLGARLPAIGSLADISALYELSPETVAYLYDADDTGVSISGVAEYAYGSAPAEKGEKKDEKIEAKKNKLEEKNAVDEESGALAVNNAAEGKVSEPADPKSESDDDSENDTEKEQDEKLKIDNEAETKAETEVENAEEEFRQQLKETAQRLDATVAELEEYRTRESKLREKQRRRFIETRGRFIPPAYHSVILDMLALLDGDAPAASEYAAPGGDSSGDNAVSRTVSTVDFMAFIDSLGAHPAMSEYGAQKTGQGGANGHGDPGDSTDLDKRIAAWCATRGLDPDDASAYARAASTVGEYVIPLPLNGRC